MDKTETKGTKVASTDRPDALHPEYRESRAKWQRCMDAYEGSDAIKAAGATYLPKLSKQLGDDYKAYRDRALFYGATERTIQGLSGAAVFKEFEFELPTQVEHLEDDATQDQLSLQQLTKKIVVELLKTGRCGILGDRGVEGTQPYLVLYEAQHIINWRFEESKPVMIMLEECVYTPNPENRFEVVESKQWRELYLETGADGRKKYGQRLWTKEIDANTKKEIFYYEEIAILARGQPLEFIPFAIINANGMGACVCKPPLLSMVDVNISHYQNSADLEHGRHFTGLPTPWIAGVKAKQDEVFYLGSQAAWLFEDPDASCGFLEFTGQGLASLETALKSKEQMMAVLGARLLDNQKAAPEAEGTLRIRNMGDTFTLSGINIAAADGLTLVIDQVCAWEAGPEDAVTVTPNTDFADTTLAAADITALVAALNAGGISLETFVWNMARGERLPPDTEVEEELARIELGKTNAADTLPPVSPQEAAQFAAKTQGKQKPAQVQSPKPEDGVKNAE